MASAAGVKAGKAFVSIEALDKTKGVLDGVANSVSKFASRMTSIGQKAITAAATLAIPLALSTNVFANFDDQMREVKAVTQATDAEFMQLSGTAKELGRTTSFTAVQIGKLMAELGRAGFKPDQVDKMTGSVLNLARATGTDLTLAGGIAAKTLRQFNLEADQGSRVADALTVAANKSFNSVETLGQSLEYAGPVADDFNMSLEDTLAILGGLGNVGIQGSSAGTALRRLLTLSGAEADRMKEIFGVAFQDSAHNARPLVDVLDEVNEATKDLGTSERAAKFSEAFGLLGITGASAISKNVVGIRELAAELKNAEGAAADAAEEMDAGLGGAFRKFSSATEGVQIALGEALAGITDFILPTNTVLEQFAKWIEKHHEIIQTLAGVAAGLAALGVGMLALGGIASGLAMALSTLAFLVTPIGALVAALAALGAGAVYLNQLTQATVKLTDAQAKLREEGDKQRATDQQRFQRLQQLAQKTQMTSAEMQEAQGIVGRLNDRYDGLNLSVNSTTGAIENMAGAQEWLNRAMAEQATLQLEKELDEARGNVQRLTKEFEDANSFWNRLGRQATTVFGDSEESIYELLNATTQAEKKVGDLQARLDKLRAGDVDEISGPAEPPAAEATTNPEATKSFQEIEKARMDAVSAEERLKAIEEARARRRRSDLQNELHDLEAVTAERHKLLDTIEAGARTKEGYDATAFEEKRLQIDAQEALDRNELLGEFLQYAHGAFAGFQNGGGPGIGKPAAALPAMEGLEKGTIAAAKSFLDAQRGKGDDKVLGELQGGHLATIAGAVADGLITVEEIG